MIMSHSVHPKAFRLKSLKDWDSRWFDQKKMPQYLEEDFKIRKILDSKIKKLGVEKIEIERFPGKIIVIVSSARPGLIIGRGGEGIEILKKELLKSAFKGSQKREVRLEIREIKDPWSSAPLVAQWVAQQIEKRISHRRAMKQAIEKVMAMKGNQGVRIELAGRLGGAEIARREWLKKGNLPRQTIRANIDFARDGAVCTYGIVGIKVWIYKGEVFE